MLQTRQSDQRGYADHGWLRSHHTFSFADYYDPSRMGFRTLRVINEDRIRGGAGFPTHPHRDMEILTYVVSGALEHKDSMGNTAVIRPGEIQHMSAGTGVRHSEFNHYKDHETHLLQIWILPEKTGISPTYGQKSFDRELEESRLVLVASRDGREGSVSLNQDADVYLSRLKAGTVSFRLRSGRGAWLQLVKGRLKVGGLELQAGDGLVAEEEQLIEIEAVEPSEFLIFDLI
jgi:quercetin 2,3-dioxygenase